MNYQYSVSSFKRWLPTFFVGVLALLTGMEWWRNGDSITYAYLLFLFAILLGVYLIAALQPVVSFRGKIFKKQLDTYATRHGRFFNYHISLEDGSEIYVPKEVFVRLDEQDKVSGVRQQKELVFLDSQIEDSRDVEERIGELEATQSAMAWRSRKRTLAIILFFLSLLMFGYWLNLL